MSILDNVPQDVDSASLSTEMFNELVVAIADKLGQLGVATAYASSGEPVKRDYKDVARAVAYGGVTYYEDNALKSRLITYWKSNGEVA